MAKKKEPKKDKKTKKNAKPEDSAENKKAKASKQDAEKKAAEKAAAKEKKEAEKAEAKKRREEEKAAAKEAAMADAEERRRNLSIHRFLVLTNRSMTDQLKAYRGEYTDVEDPEFNIFNSLLEKKGPPELPEAFGDYEASRIAEVNALVADVKKHESVMARLALAGATTDEISSVAGYDVSKSGIFSGKGVGRKQIAAKIRGGALRDTLFDHLIGSKIPNEDLLNASYIAGKRKIGEVKDDREAEKKQTRDEDMAARIEVALKKENERNASAEERRNQKELEERRRNYADNLRARGMNEAAGMAEAGTFDSFISDHWDYFGDKNYGVVKGRRLDEEARRKREEAERKEREREEKRREEEARRDLELRRSNAADYFKAQGRNKFAAEVAVGMHDDFVRDNWENLSQDRYAIFKGQRQDQKQQEEEEERQRKERERDEERRRKEEQAQRLREQKELDQKRELWAQYQEYSADADGRRFTATERLGITSGAAGRDREFSDKSIDELEEMLAGAKDRAATANESRNYDEENTRELKTIVRILTGIRLSTAQSKKLMQRFGMSGAGFGKLGLYTRLAAFMVAAVKGLINAKEKEFARGLKSGNELTGGTWTMGALGMSKEEKEDIKRESVAARRYGVTNQEILQARQKTAAGIAALHNGDPSFFEPLWKVGFPVSVPTDTKDFEEQLTKFLNDATVTKHQKVAVMQALGRNEKQMAFSMNREEAMQKVDQDSVDQAIAADKKEQALTMARNQIERRYEDEKKHIEISNTPMILKWIPHLMNWASKMNEMGTLNYNEEAGSAYHFDYRGKRSALQFLGPLGNMMLGRSLQMTPPSLDNINAESQKITDRINIASSSNAGTKNEITVNAEYHITGSREDAEKIRDAVKDSQREVAADISNNNNVKELGGR